MAVCPEEHSSICIDGWLIKEWRLQVEEGYFPNLLSRHIKTQGRWDLIHNCHQNFLRALAMSWFSKWGVLGYQWLFYRAGAYSPLCRCAGPGVCCWGEGSTTEMMFWWGHYRIDVVLGTADLIPCEPISLVKSFASGGCTWRELFTHKYCWVYFPLSIT